MFLPEKLYQFTEKDKGGYPLIQPYNARQSTATAATTVTTTLTLDQIGDRFFMMQSACSKGVFSGVQYIANGQISLLSPATDGTPQEYELAGWRQPDTTTGTDWVNWSGSLLVPPFWRIRAAFVFVGGATANTVSIAVFGALLPRGSINRL